MRIRLVDPPRAVGDDDACGGECQRRVRLLCMVTTASRKPASEVVVAQDVEVRRRHARHAQDHVLQAAHVLRMAMVLTLASRRINRVARPRCRRQTRLSKIRTTKSPYDWFSTLNTARFRSWGLLKVGTIVVTRALAVGVPLTRCARTPARCRSPGRNGLPPRRIPRITPAANQGQHVHVKVPRVDLAHQGVAELRDGLGIVHDHEAARARARLEQRLRVQAGT